MSRKRTDVGTVDTTDLSPLDRPLDGVAFASPLLQLMKAAVGRYVRHDPGCQSVADQPCDCGLTAALADLQRRELLLQRYGTE